MSAPDKTATITFTVTAGVASTPVISGGTVPNGKYTIQLGVKAGINSQYLAISSPIGAAENANFQPFGPGLG